MSEEEQMDTPAEAPVDAHEDLIAKTNAAAARLEKATAESKAATELLKAQQVEATLGGTATAGVDQKKETPGEYAKRMMGETND